ncbi:hypothetical protein SPRG_15066 [Saprolegnia parasitica CBS 223.65]|uniref:RING-type E3 ubiquitin transferase n=1 Tax=Saprolegnia parasitica (strain CBS 223.65) TaxID=695850 RepID=A0A067BZL5_SAPPC|nr:hypothetical protein SPRG_15066 [Saprolegnia parasitica CBS 223.65]KDO19736.1 hypothetical protein SPRG_15066 [Saprolegnia parasitica CBS 223.65]|eukprot:XP_012209547.1 hypothetical protein SPRG_15066 [Saprolegnia parasitica CBS 223.65]
MQAVNLRATIQYKPPANTTVQEALDTFRSPQWVGYMLRHIVPFLKASSGAKLHVLADLPKLARCDSDCVICMGAMDDGAIELPCGHHFHTNCIDAWLRLRNTCPTCRYQFEKQVSGTYAIRSINTALCLDGVRSADVDDVLSRSLDGSALSAIVHVTMVPAATLPPMERYPCVMNAAIVRGPAPTPNAVRSPTAKRSRPHEATPPVPKHTKLC